MNNFLAFYSLLKNNDDFTFLLYLFTLLFYLCYMRIIQITDLHIYPKEEMINGVDTRQNFIKILKKISNIPHDMVIITGDLSFFDADIKVYQWIKKQFDVFNIKNYYVIGGNHDKAKMLAESFNFKKDLHNDELYYSIEPDYIFLDTIKGYCSKEQLKWFEKKILDIKDKNPMIFMHHPPFKSGVPHMDNKYAFEQTDEFIRICSLNPNPVYVFCGHYHNEISLIRDNINMFITPATYLQIYMFNDDFEVDHRIPTFRIIDIDKKQIKTTVRYVYD